MSNEAVQTVETKDELEAGLENLSFDELYEKLEDIRGRAVIEHVHKTLEALIEAAENGRLMIADTLAQPHIVNELEAHIIRLDPKLAFSQATPELDKAMTKILDIIRANRKLREDEKASLVKMLNTNNGAGSNYVL